MLQKVNLFYSVPVVNGTVYNLNVRIGDAQPGDINVVYAECPYKTEPIDNEQEWTTELSTGEKLRDKKIVLSSLTKNENGLTNRVSIRVFINGKEIIPQSHTDDPDPHIKEVSNGTLVQFVQKIVFL